MAVNQASPADIILQQLGGANKLALLTGAKHFMSDDDGRTLVFSLPKTKGGVKVINRVRVTLNGLDLYDVKFFNVTISRKTFEARISNTIEHENIYAEDLKQLIEDTTGLYLSIS